MKISVNARGAELDSLFSKETNIEYLWSGDQKFWSKKSPLLFPIVGTLKQNTYYYNNKPYNLSRHGFARESEFSLSDHTDVSATLSLSDSEQTLANFPFPFKLDVVYSVEGTTVHVKYKITNTGSDNMYFSIGAHPAFRVPLEKRSTTTIIILSLNR